MSDEMLQQPGEVILNMLEMRGWTQTVLASVLGKPVSHINGVIKGKRPITAELAVGLASAFGTEADFWLTLEAQKQLALLPSADDAVQRRARCYEIAPVKEMQKRGWIRDTAAADELVEELQRFLHQPDLSTPPRFQVAMRRTTNDDTSELTPQQCAWCYRAAQIARGYAVPPFDESRLSECTAKLRKLAALKADSGKAATCLAEYGIRFVVVEQLSGSLVDGAAFWLDEQSPVIAMTLRFDRIDNFWFTLFHELSHIRHRDAISVDSDLSGSETSLPCAAKSPIELRADNEATSTLIDPPAIESFIKRVRPMYSRTRIIQFANRIKLHPGIIVGQLQHRGEIGFHAHKEFLAKVREFVTPSAVTDGWGYSVSVTE